jgi:hypothetical protein
VATVEEKRKLVAKLTTEIAAGEKLAADAAGFAAQARNNMERLKAGEYVNVGKPIDFHTIQKAAGLSEADIRTYGRWEDNQRHAMPPPPETE